MSKIKPSWTRYRDMGGPLYRGEKKNGKYVHVYNPSQPWGVWSQILGVVARCEGNFDTIVMYNGTGCTVGAFQWTFKSGRLQRMLEFLKSIPYCDFESDEELGDWTLFDEHCTEGGKQIFERFGFAIKGGRFCLPGMNVLYPRKAIDRKCIIDTCMGRRALLGKKEERRFALDLCALFARLGQQPGIQAAMIEYAKIEFKQALDVRRKPLKSVGGTIRCLLPDEVWGSPIPAIFFNLFQNSPGGAFALFKNALKTALKKGVIVKEENRYKMKEEDVQHYLDIIWRRLNRTAYADWGWRSKQYVESGGRNPPRIKRIKPAIKEFYGIELPFYKG